MGYNLGRPASMTPDLQPTERLPTFPDHFPSDDDALVEQGRRGPNIAGFIGRLVLLVLVLLGGLIAAALLLTPTRQSILILGSDARPDEIKLGVVGRTDTLLLLVADRAAPRLAMVSVPRDLWVAIPAHGEERVNAAFELGGSQTAKQTVSNLLGQPVDRYTLIGLQGVRDVVDAAGGVDITVAQAIHDDTYPTDDYGYQTVDIPAGLQHMNGDTALKYARTRHQDSDFGRIARQQQVVAAVRSAMLSPLNWPRIPAVAVAVGQAIRTDLGPLDAVAIGAAVLRQPGDPERLVIDTTLVTPVVGQDGAYLLEPKPDLKPAVARFVGVSASTASVEILNGTGIAGLAARTADRLAQRGFVISSVGDAPRAQSQTTILARTGARGAADRVASTLGVPTGRVTESASLGSSDVQVILGADAR
ncbi:MAG: LCP family protein [Chloroflexota bacterium]|nr:LCP family protein [Chloroflexota bacterium]